MLRVSARLARRVSPRQRALPARSRVGPVSPRLPVAARQPQPLAVAA
ncbi:MAG TPA: hypothetical protein VGS57_06500 [Thermoanaerobaculia bacterium]|nr:hypothetical protein [Thermoanaerobaculia bacterium]